MSTEISRVYKLLMDFESRIAWLERIVSCPRCHGSKINKFLTGEVGR